MYQGHCTFVSKQLNVVWKWLEMNMPILLKWTHVVHASVGYVIVLTLVTVISDNKFLLLVKDYSYSPVYNCLSLQIHTLMNFPKGICLNFPLHSIAGRRPNNENHL